MQNKISDFIMKNKLTLDLEFLGDLNISREDNLIQIKVVLCKSLSLHRGHKEPLVELVRMHRRVHQLFMQCQTLRNAVQQQTCTKYQGLQINQGLKTLLFAFVSRVQRASKGFSNKIHSVLNPAYQSVCDEYSDHQTDTRHFALERIGKQSKLGNFIRDFQNIMSQRYKRELGKFLGFYQVFSYLIDKRAQKPEICPFKQDKYRLVTSQQSVEMSVKNFMHLLGVRKRQSGHSFQTSLKGLKNLDVDQGHHSSVAAIHQIIGEEGFCEAYISKIDKLSRDLTLRNSAIQKLFPVSKPKEISRSIPKPVHRQSFCGGRKSMCESVTRNTLRTSDVQVPDKQLQRRSVLRQTLVQIVINNKQEKQERHLPSLKDKSFRSQAYNLYRKVYSVKQN